MNHLILALLAATFSLSVLAAPSNLNSSRSQSDRVLGQQGVQDDNQIVKSKSNITNNRETALQGADTCSFTIDEKGVKRQATEAQKQKCEKAPNEAKTTINNSKSNNLREQAPTKTQDKPGLLN
jgi:uncharacterized protein YdeI (BOF family)